MLTTEIMEAAVKRYIDGLNAGDLDAIVSLYADNATVEDPLGSPAQVGLDAIRSFYAKSLALKLDVSLDGPIRSCSNTAAFAFSVRFIWEGKVTTISPIDVFIFNENGQVQSMKAIFGPSNIRPD